MPTIYDNIVQPLLPALSTALSGRHSFQGNASVIWRAIQSAVG
jgi:hypothetical protein